MLRNNQVRNKTYSVTGALLYCGLLIQEPGRVHYNTLQRGHLSCSTHLQKHGHHSRVPVVSDENTVLAGAEGERTDGLNAGLGKHAESLWVVNVVSS